MKLYLIKEQVWDVVETEVKAEDKEKDQFVKKNLKAFLPPWILFPKVN